MRRISWCRWKSPVLPPSRARAAPSAKPNRMPPPNFWRRSPREGAKGMTTRCGFCAILGAPNAGKSTLTNALVGSKVAIVSPKVQTTRMAVRGVAVKDDTQIVFVDTPGIFKPRRRLDRAMVGAAWAGAEDSEAILLVVDAADLVANPQSLAARDTDAILEGLKNLKGKKSALVLNKIDGMKRTDLLPLVEKFRGQGLFEDIFLVSALKGEGVDD